MPSAASRAMPLTSTDSTGRTAPTPEEGKKGDADQ